jgi:hypothetical protein
MDSRDGRDEKSIRRSDNLQWLIVERVRLIYEQLEEAKRLIREGFAPKLRLALILLDNAAELLMYRELQRQFAKDDYWRRGSAWRGPNKDRTRIKYTDEDRRRAKEEFAPMTKLLEVRLGRISSQNRTILDVCHKVRRDAFHRGEMNSRIFEAVTRLLFVTVVNLTTKLPFQSFIIVGGTGTNEDSAFLTRFRFSEAAQLATDDAKAQLAAVLLDGVPFDAPEFGQVLASDLEERIESIMGGIAYVNDECSEDQADGHLQYGQFWKEQGADIATACDRQGRACKEDLDAAFQQWLKNPGPKFTFEKLRVWQRRASAIRNIRAPANMLAGYWAIHHRIGDLEEEVLKGVAEYEDYIDMLIHDRGH